MYISGEAGKWSQPQTAAQLLSYIIVIINTHTSLQSHNEVHVNKARQWTQSAHIVMLHITLHVYYIDYIYLD